MTQPGGGSFAVDIARAPKAIRELEQARDELQEIKRDATYLGQVNPPARDQVSLDAAQALGQVGVGGPTSFVEALTAGIEEISRMIEALRSGLATYERGDQSASSEFVQSP